MSQADTGELVKQIRRSNMSLDDLISGGPNPQTSSLVRQHESFTTTLLKQACQEAGHSLDDPGSVDQYWFRDQQMLVIDLDPKSDP